jgi:hypothetical protein
MSVEVLAQLLDRLLSDATPRILAVDGDWGVGKTFQWGKRCGDGRMNQTRRRSVMPTCHCLGYATL